MGTQLVYGNGLCLELAFPPGALVGDFSALRAAPLNDAHAAIKSALADPIEFPHLSRAIVPGDQVVVALEPGLPHAAVIVRELVETVLVAGCRAENLTVLCAGANAVCDPEDATRELESSLRSRVTLLCHDPEARDSLGFLTSMHDGRPLYLNRCLCNADLVVPVGVIQCRRAIGFRGAFSALYPTFADSKAQLHYRVPPDRDAKSVANARAQLDADEVGWLLGSQFAVSVVPGWGDSAIAILAGDAGAIHERGLKICEAAWWLVAPCRASLVVVSLAGDASSQSWDNLGRALAVASDFVEQDGAIAVCTQLSENPGPAVESVRTSTDRDRALKKIKKERPADTLAAMELQRALSRARVYLLSDLDETLVEELGMVPIQQRQVARLLPQFPSCIVVSGAQHAVASTTAEESQRTLLAGGKQVRG